MSDDKILERIQKLLALATSSNEHEAAAAMAKAQALMTEHGLSEARIKLADIGHIDVKSQFSVSQMKPYELMLMNCISRAFSVKVLWRKSHSRFDDVYGCFTFVGRKANVQVAEHVAIVLGRKMKKARADFVRTLPATAHKTKEADGYCLGWVYAIARKVMLIAMDDETAGLVEYYSKRQFNLTDETADAQKREVGYHGYQRGAIDGENESLHRPMEQGHRAASIGATLKIEGPRS